jgi:phage gp46-like protein
MPLNPDDGSDFALVRNPATGRFDLDWEDSPNPRSTDDESPTVLSLLLEKKGGYWADETGKRGSLLHTVKQDVAATASTLVAYSKDALAPAVDDGRLATDPVISAERSRPGRYALDIRYRGRDGRPRNVRLPFSG